jgi:allophanate hydrolase
MRLRALTRLQLAAAGAWGGRAWTAAAGEVIELPPTLAGVWHYLALPGGIQAPKFLGSASVCARADIGRPLAKGDALACAGPPDQALPAGVKGRQPSRLAAPAAATPLRVWPGPQWSAFAAAERERFLAQTWRISARSDRSGYRLEGPALAAPAGELVSEPVRVGSVQVPPGGQPVITLYDGPTVGGYAKIALVEAADLDRLVQARAGQDVTFRRAR